MGTAQETKTGRRPLIAFMILLATWVIGGVVQGLLWEHFDENRTSQVMSVWVIAPTLFFCTMVWWTFFSGFKLVTKLLGWGFLILTGAVLLGVFRFEGFDGDFVPRFAYRWEPTAEELFLAAREAKSNYEGELPALENPDQPLEVQPGDWPQFRGPNGDGIVSPGNIRRDWSDGPPQPVWKQRVGPAWTSFTIVDGLVFTQMQIAEDECVVCYEMETGQEVWVHKDEGVRFHEERAGTGPMGTPLFYRGRLYTLGAMGHLNCLNPKTGEAYWSANILDDANSENLVWGMAGSPIAHQDMILVNPGSDDEEQTAVAAYNWETGEKLWAGGHHQASYSTPVVATLDGTEQLLVFDGLGLSGHSLKDGSPLWHKGWTNGFQINVAKPIVRKDESIFISTSYGTGSALLRVTQADDGTWPEPKTTDWETNQKFKLKFGDAVLKDGLIYGLSETILTCLDFETGKILWRKRGDYGFGQLILVDDVLVILTDEGKVVLVEASDDHPELLRFQAIEGKTWGHPAYAQGRLFVRNAEEMACFDLRSSKSKTQTEQVPFRNADAIDKKSYSQLSEYGNRLKELRARKAIKELEQFKQKTLPMLQDVNIVLLENGAGIQDRPKQELYWASGKLRNMLKASDEADISKDEERFNLHMETARKLMEQKSSPKK